MISNLLDGPSALIVLGGTGLATTLRCGPGDCWAALRAVLGLVRPGFKAANVRAELAAQVLEIRQVGMLRAEPHHSGDAEFDEAADAIIGQRSVAGLVATHERHKSMRHHASHVAVRTLAQAAELTPVFGMVGTLVSLSALPADGLARGALTGAIAMAVLSTLYGLVAANLLLAPLARIVERSAAREEVERQAVLDWLTGQLFASAPAPTSAPSIDTRTAAA